MSTDNPLKIAVCDDIQADRIQIISMAKQLLQDEGIAHSISEYEDATPPAYPHSKRYSVSYPALRCDAGADEWHGACRPAEQNAE